MKPEHTKMLSTFRKMSGLHSSKEKLEKKLDLATQALTAIAKGELDCGHCTRGGVTVEELAEETLKQMGALDS